MPKTLIRGSDVDAETTVRLAQLILDGYGFSIDEQDDVTGEYLTGLIMRSGDIGPATLMIGAADGYIDQIADGYVTFRGFTSVRNNAEVRGDLVSNKLVNGQELDWKTVTAMVTVTAAAQQTTPVVIPASSEVVSVSMYVSVKPPGTSTVDVGVAGSAIARKRYGANIPTTVGSSHPGLETPGTFYVPATPIVLNFNTAPTNTSGRIRLTIHYRAIIPPSS